MTDKNEGDTPPGKPSLTTIRKLCYSAIITVLMFAAVEGILRLIHFQFEPQYSIYVENRWTKHGVGPDPTLPWSWMPIPGADCIIDKRSSFKFNSLGYRGPLFEPKKAAGDIRIVCLGDSGTMGWGVKDEETYCAAMKNFIESECDKKIETINAGVFGYSSFQGVHQLQTRIVDLRPDFITICYNWNDHGGAIRMAEQAGEYAWNKGLPQRDRDLPGASSWSGLQQVLSRLRLFQLMSFGALHFRKVPTTAEESKAIKTELVRVPLDDYRQNMIRMIEIARKNQITPILLTQALNPISPFPREKHDAYNEIVIQVASEMNVPYVDARDLLKDDAKLFSSNTHPTRKGHQRIAIALSKKIRFLAGCYSGETVPRL